MFDRTACNQLSNLHCSVNMFKDGVFKEEEMGGAYSIHGGDVTFITTVAGEHKRRDHLGDLGINGSLMLKCTSILSD